MNIRDDNGYIRPIKFDNYDAVSAFLEGVRLWLKRHEYISVCDVADLAGLEADYSDTMLGWSASDLTSGKGPMLSHVGGGPYRVFMPTERYIGRIAVSKEAVNHPDHYQAETGMEVIDVMEAFTFDLKGIEAVDTSNVIKYICRWKKKNGLQDLKKARWYLEHLINHVEKMEKENENNG